ncbi:hypothetical protein G4Y73_00765 [Wenzhouxiangella sp. XN201]|uniref:hypothetical protein n=1 Tax=Wenzhouxiangella sp. XN201 TaxID=2710755 RepID=UPI0013C9EF59|nr:hypothetical protein [Wenzhouxiangella sp. XN201]NEZ02676.1 hypothetical protein [Wenzhouxiangella sp. XN201]
MSDSQNDRGAEAREPEQDQERLPVMQRILDNPFLLLFLGVTIPTVTYIIWGVMNIVTVPIG